MIANSQSIACSCLSCELEEPPDLNENLTGWQEYSCLFSPSFFYIFSNFSTGEFLERLLISSLSHQQIVQEQFLYERARKFIFSVTMLTMNGGILVNECKKCVLGFNIAVCQQRDNKQGKLGLKSESNEILLRSKNISLTWNHLYIIFSLFLRVSQEWRMPAYTVDLKHSYFGSSFLKTHMICA